MTRRLRRATFVFLGFLGTSGLIAFVALSPALLDLAYRRTSRSALQRYAALGGTYGAASAIVAALAFTAVAASIVFQSRSARISAMQSLRSLHFDLMKLSLDDPSLLDAWGPFTSAVERAQQRQHIYVNMILQHWWLMYESGVLPDAQLKLMSTELMQGDAAREYWEVAKAAQQSERHSSMRKRFTGHMDRAFLAGLTARGANVAANPHSHRNSSTNRS